MSDLQELIRTTCGQGNPTPEFYVSVEDARKLLGEIKQLRGELAETRKAVGTYIDVSLALTRERDEARWAVRYLLENITPLQTRADLYGLRKKLTWLEAD